MDESWKDRGEYPDKNADRRDCGNEEDAAAPVVGSGHDLGARPHHAVDVSEIDEEIEAAIKEKDSEDAAQEEAAVLSNTDWEEDEGLAASRLDNDDERGDESEAGEDEVSREREGQSQSGSNNGSYEEDEEASHDDPHRPPYPPPPPGYEHYPPPPGFYPYPPHYPPHPHFGYPPPPPGYYPPPPPGYYPPPGHPNHLPPPRPQVPPVGELDPSTGTFIYGGPPPSQPGPAKRSRLRIKTPQDIMNRKIRKNSQSRHRAARLRDKVDTIKSKGEELTEEEAQLYDTVEERRHRKNNRSRERALEKKAELERITAKPEDERTPQETEILNIAVNAKRRKNEGDRLRRERIKKMGLKSKPPGMSIRSRPRKPLSGEGILPYGAAPPGMPGIPDVGPPPGVGPPIMPGMPPLLHAGPDAYQYPPPAPHPHAYPPPNPYYAEPPPMKEEENSDEDDGHDHSHDEGTNHLEDRPHSANPEQEVSALLLHDPPDVVVEEDELLTV
eukprot:CAMPEP_0181096084 /NCGR_PEP_ID=MMETSP1071-20121207/10847_1 /TAXON_ID=35127 /ORGANISM="Thalassiosira sp., Strain NH16" /LENGTH=498 /DNA_ID=CAMNT_0023178475 /DNA_START=85 /DNA_END=1582 /DNA_ORIENTATION=-